MRKLQSQGVHHITIVGANRRTSIDFWEGCWACRSPSSSRTSTTSRRATCTSIRATGGDHGLHERGARARPDQDLDGHRLRAPPLRAFAGDVQAGERLDERERHSGPNDRGFMDRSIDAARAPGRAIVPLRAAGRARTPRCCSTTSLRVERGDYNITSSTWPMPSRRSSRGRESRCPETAPPTRTAREGGDNGRQPLSILAERQQPDCPHLRPGSRARVRGAGRLGQEEHARSSPSDLGRPDAAARRGRCAAEGRALGELRDHAAPLRKHGSTSSIPVIRASGRWSTARCSTSSARSIRCSRARRTRRSASRSTRRGRHVRRRRRRQGEGREGRRGCARRAARGLQHVLPGRPEVHRGDNPSIADMRFAATLEFLRAIDYELPAWAEDYIGQHGGRPRRGVHRAGRRRARLRRQREGAPWARRSRTLVVHNLVSLDGFSAGPEGDLMALPFDPAFDEACAERLRVAGDAPARPTYTGVQELGPRSRMTRGQPPAPRDSRRDNDDREGRRLRHAHAKETEPWRETTEILSRANATSGSPSSSRAAGDPRVRQHALERPAGRRARGRNPSHGRACRPRRRRLRLRQQAGRARPLEAPRTWEGSDNVLLRYGD